MSEAAGKAKLILTADGTSYSVALKAAQAQLDKLQGKTREAGHATVSSMQAASASIRLFEGGMTNNIRAVERFISSIPGVSKALQFAFPLVGGLAFAGLLVKMGEEFAEFIKKAEDAPRVIQDAFRSMNTSTQQSVDELHKANDQLENQIAKLEGKPQNNVAIALDDARIAADKLAQSLQNDQQKLKELLKQNGVGWLAALFTGQDDTKDLQKKVNDWQQKMADQGHAYNLAVHKFGPDSTQAKDAKAALAKLRKDAEADMQSEIDYRKPGPDRAANVTGDQTANLNIASGYLTQLQAQDDLATEQADNEKLTKKQQALQQAKDLAEAQKQADAKLLQGFRQHLDQLKAAHDMSATEESDYWTHLALSVKKGSDAYKTAMDEAAKAMIPARKALAEENDKLLAATTSPTRSFFGPDGKVQVVANTFTNSKGEEQPGTAEWGGGEEDLSKNSDMTRGISEQSRAITEWLKNLNAVKDIQDQNADAMAEASLQMAVATGQMTRHDAAVVQAQLHTQEYNDALEQLQSALASLPNSGLTSDEQKARASEIQNQIAVLEGNRKVQQAYDEEQKRATSGLGEFNIALHHLANDFTDVGAQMSQLVADTLNNLNASLAQALMAHTYNGREYRRGILNALSNTARGAGEEGLNSVFQNIEGEAIKALIGKNPNEKKPKGTQSDPIYTKNADQGQGGSGLLGGLLGKLFGKFFGSGSGILDLGSGGMGSLGPGSLPSIFGDGGPPGMDLSGMGDTGTSIPGFADGGDPFVNRPNLVGERGPELFVPRTAGTIIPNDKLFGENHSWYIDARGNNDPAGTIAQFDRYMQRAAPQIAASAVRAKDETNLRRPPSARR